MSYEPKDGQGALFKNTKKDPETKQPDYRGDVMLGGVVYELAGWIKNSGKGPFLSLAGKPKTERAAQVVERHNTRQDDPEIPF